MIDGKMPFGAVFPTTQISHDRIAVRDWTQTAEALGFDRIVAYDHPVGAQKLGREDMLEHHHYTNEHEYGEPMTLFAFMAAITSRIQLSTGVLVLGQRQAVLVAKQASQVAVLSDGRFVLGVGAGSNPVEFEALNVDYNARFKIFDEQIELMRQLWRQDLVDFTGAFHRVDRVSQFPHPPGDTIPIWVGGVRESALRRAARYADGFIFGTPKAYCFPMVPQLQELLRKQHRDPANFPMEYFIDNGWGEAHWRHECDEWGKIGGTHFSLRTTDEGVPFFKYPPSGFTKPQQHIDALRPFAEAMISRN